MNDMTPNLPAQIQAMQTQLQSAQDVINALSDQRNSANNQVVNLTAQLQAVNRQVTEKDEALKLKDVRIADLEAQVEKLGMSQDDSGETDLTE